MNLKVRPSLKSAIFVNQVLWLPISTWTHTIECRKDMNSGKEWIAGYEHSWTKYLVWLWEKGKFKKNDMQKKWYAVSNKEVQKEDFNYLFSYDSPLLIHIKKIEM